MKKSTILALMFIGALFSQIFGNTASAIDYNGQNHTPDEWAKIIATTPGAMEQWYQWALKNPPGTPERDALDRAMTNYGNSVPWINGLSNDQLGAMNPGTTVQCSGPCFAGGGKFKLTPDKTTTTSGTPITFTLDKEALAIFDCSWSRNGVKQTSVTGKSFVFDTTNIVGSSSITLSCLAGNTLPLTYATSDTVVITTTATGSNNVSSTLSDAMKTKIDALVASKIVARQSTMSTENFSSMLNKLVTAIKAAQKTVTDRNKLAILSYLLVKVTDIQNNLSDDTFLNNFLN